MLAKYIYDAEGALLHIEIGTNKYYPIYDGLGSIISLRDQNGTTVQSYEYDDWGKIASAGSSITQSLRFGAYFWDKDAELYHLGARWYDPTLARFVSVDPHPGDQDDGLSQNEYIYCRNNPINFTDPDGDYIETALDVASVAYSANEFKKKRSWGNAGYLAFDSVMLVLPIVPGTGVMRAGIKAGKGGKAVVKTEKVAKIAEKIEWHHIQPQYLGGAKKGKLVGLPKSYHQKITNEFRRLAPYGTPAKQIKKDTKLVKQIMKKVYKKYPIKKFKMR